jgi:hypothetical protein
MHARLHAELARTGGLVTRAAALDAGLTPSRLTQLIKGGDLVVLRRGVYADAELWDSLDVYLGKPRLRARAAMANLQRAWVASHDSAALELAMPLIRPQESLTHITRPGYSTAWTRYGVKHHYARFLPGQTLVVDGRKVLGPARTAVDLAREHGEMAGVAACDWALRNGTSRAELIEAYLPMEHWTGVPDARSAVDLADPRAENLAESLGRMLVRELDIGTPDPQFPVEIETGVAWCDVRVGNHMFEMDGFLKYVPKDQGGLLVGSVQQVIWEEKKRERLIRAEGLGLSRILYEDYWGDRREAAKRRLRAEYDVTEQRFGPVLHARLARSAEEIRRRRGWRDRALSA